MGQRLIIHCESTATSNLDKLYFKTRDKITNDTYREAYNSSSDNRTFLTTYQQWGAYTLSEIDTMRYMLERFSKYKNVTHSGFENMANMTRALISLGMVIQHSEDENNKQHSHDYLVMFEILNTMIEDDTLNDTERACVIAFATDLTNMYHEAKRQNFNQRRRDIDISGLFAFSPALMKESDDWAESITSLDMHNKTALLSCISEYDVEDDPSDYFNDEEEMEEINEVSINPDESLTVDELKALYDQITTPGLIKYDNTLYEQISG